MTDQERPTDSDWHGRGYFACPTTIPTSPLDIVGDWDTWRGALNYARRGVFDFVPKLIPIYHRSNDIAFRRACASLLGDAGTGECFSQIVEDLERTMFMETMLHFSECITTRGKLADVPLLVRTFMRFPTGDDWDTIPILLSIMLEPERGALYEPAAFASVNDYSSAAMSRCKELVSALGSDQVYVYRGSVIDVTMLAKTMLEFIQGGQIPIDLERRFVASTGIDSATFYRDGFLQPLGATAIVEEFLESPDAAKYEPGVRYFFGHRIPD